MNLAGRRVMIRATRLVRRTPAHACRVRFALDPRRWVLRIASVAPVQGECPHGFDGDEIAVRPELADAWFLSQIDRDWDDMTPREAMAHLCGEILMVMRTNQGRRNRATAAEEREDDHVLHGR